MKHYYIRNKEFKLWIVNTQELPQQLVNEWQVEEVTWLEYYLAKWFNIWL